MAKLLLLRPKMSFVDAMPNPPMGLGYISALLKKHGHQVDIIDCAILNESYSQITSRIKQLEPDMIGITALSSYYPEMIILSQKLRELKIPIILGGVHVSALPELSLRECGADFVVIGEGELTMLEFMNLWEDIEKCKQINGIAYFENGQFIRNPARKLIENLDEIPFPDWDQINPLNYPPLPHGRIMERYPVAPILTTRGCPYSCSYCASTNFWGNKFRRRSPKNVVDEIEYLVQRFGIREIHIWDDNFTLVKKHVIGICQEILRRKLDLTFVCPNGVRIDFLSEEILKIMRKTGFYSIIFAVESGSQKILKRAGKKIDLKIIPKTAKLAKKLGFIVPSYFILGLPGETYETARRTIQFAKSIPFDGAAFFIARPLPGSRLFEEWVKNKDISEIKKSWFNFYVTRDELILSDGKRKLKLPEVAHREFYFRPIQVLRVIKVWLRCFHLKQIFIVLRRFLRVALF